jgi:hypothetical protein
MSIVDVIKSQLTPEVIGKLSSLIGADEDKTRSALGAAVPAVLSGLAGLSSRADGAERVINALRQVDPGTTSNLPDVLSHKGGSMMELGTKLLGMLFQGGALAAIVGALVRNSGLTQMATKSLLSLVLPLVLSAISGQFKGRALTPQGLTSFFADEKADINRALPAGFSLADIPGLADTAAAASGAAGSLAKWLIPLAALGLIGLLLWSLFGGKTTEEPVAPAGGPVAAPVPPPYTPDTVKVEVPDIDVVSKDMTNFFTSTTEALSGIKDEATAESALPKLRDLKGNLDGIKALWDKLASDGKATITRLVTSKLDALKELVAKVEAIPGVGPKIKPVLDPIVDGLAAFSG